jgi:hypothetical protein
MAILSCSALFLGAGLGVLGFLLGRRSVPAPLAAAAVTTSPPVAEIREPVKQPMETASPSPPPSERLSASLEPPVSPGKVLAFSDIESACGDLSAAYSNYLCLVNRGSESAAGGARLVITEDLASFSTNSTYSNGITINVEGKERYSLDFGPPKGKALIRGLYSGAVRWPFNDGPYPGIDVTVGSSGCNEEEGQFRVVEFDLTGDRKVLRFVADFETTCNGAIGRISIVKGGQLPGPAVEMHRHVPGSRGPR